MGDNERLTQAKIAFFENKYMPFLSQNGIECQRSHNQAINSGNNYHGGHSSNMYGGNMYQHQQENYFASGQEPGQGQFDDDDDDNAANAGVQRQNSRDADLYDDDDINEGGNAGVDNIADQVAASGVLEDNDDENDNDAEMQIQQNDDDDDDENMMVDDQNEEEQ